MNEPANPAVQNDAKTEVRWTHFFWNYWLFRVPANARTLLDVCAGRGIVGAMNKIYLNCDSTAIEIFQPSAEFSRQFYDHMINADALTTLKTIPSKTFDVVTCFDAIEHFSMEDARHLLREMERVAKHMVFVSSVNWFYEQGDYDGNQHQAHRCLITSREIERHGYTARGFGYRSKFFGSFLFRVPLRHFETGYFAWKDVS